MGYFCQTAVIPSLMGQPATLGAGPLLRFPRSGIPREGPLGGLTGQNSRNGHLLTLMLG